MFCSDMSGLGRNPKLAYPEEVNSYLFTGNYFQEGILSGGVPVFGESSLQFFLSPTRVSKAGGGEMANPRVNPRVLPQCHEQLLLFF